MSACVKRELLSSSLVLNFLYFETVRSERNHLSFVTSCVVFSVFSFSKLLENVYRVVQNLHIKCKWWQW